MNWKMYKALDKAAKKSEAYYIIGLDVGNDSSAIAFYNLAEGVPEAIDLSGGYGKPSVPTVMQYIPDNKEWVFGEYAVLNRGVGTIYTRLMERMGDNDHLDVGGRSVSVARVFSLFIKHLLASVSSINPKAVIVGIVVAVPAYFSDKAKEEFRKVFKLAGYEKQLIALVPDRECLLTHSFPSPPEGLVNLLLLDFGSRELRGGIYQVSALNKDRNEIAAVSMSSIFDDNISMMAINNHVKNLFRSFLPDADKFADQIETFAYQHRDILFQKNIRTRPLKLYYNFAYPPVQHTLNFETVRELTAPYVSRFNRFIKDVLEKNLGSTGVAQVDGVLCVGGGFEMLWVREAVTAFFPKERVRFYKNPKLINAEGAALIAAGELGFDVPKLRLEDRHRFVGDIGILEGDRFLTLVEGSGFWWQKHPSRLVLVNRPVDGDVELGFAIRYPEGTSRVLERIWLEGLPVRPKGTTRLEVCLSFDSNIQARLNIRDGGFGEMFPRVDYEREFSLRLDEGDA